MAVKAVLSFMKKIPAEQEFSSQSYHLSLEIELPNDVDQPQVRTKIHETYAMVRAAVEDELRGNGQQSPASHGLPPKPDSGPTRTGKAAQAATNRQCRYLIDIWSKQHKRTLSELNELIRREYGADGPYGLTKKQAGDLITRLKNVNTQAA